MEAVALTPGQLRILEAIGQSDLASRFYLTGGTALAGFFLHHRRSLDLDLFSRDAFDPKQVVRLLNQVAEGALVPRRVQDRYEFTVPIAGERLRVEFVHYAFDRVDPTGPRHAGVQVDSLRDIAANKLSSIIERSEAKDFVDLYFLLHDPLVPLEQAIDDCRTKFGWPGLEYLLQSAFLKAIQISSWPQTHPALAVADAQRFFRQLARSLIRLDPDPGHRPQ